MKKIFNFDRVSLYRNNDPIMNSNRSVVSELEKAYGKYLFVPFDIPLIKPKDEEAFVSWYKAKSLRSVKKMSNIANPNGIGNNHFFTINGSANEDEVWSQNVVDDTFILFPELKEQLLEFFPITYLGRWRMWNSTEKIKAHRDDDTMIDCPMALRVKLYDTNPAETLWITKENALGVIDTTTVAGPHIHLKTRSETNSFAWNNLRTFHGSEYDPSFYKILWIITCDTNLHVNRYVDIMDRSISKYTESLIIDSDPREIYYNV